MKLVNILIILSEAWLLVFEMSVGNKLDEYTERANQAEQQIQLLIKV